MFQRRLLARIDEDECSLHGVILAAGLIALSRTVKASCERRGDSETGNANLFSVSNRSDPYCIIFLKFIKRQGEVDLLVPKNALKWARQRERQSVVPTPLRGKNHFHSSKTIF